MDDIATNQTLTHLTNITGFLREIAAELKAINRREAAKEARRSPRSAIKSSKPGRP